MNNLDHKNNLCIIGSTGSVGSQTLQFIESHRQTGNIVSLACKSNITMLERQIAIHKPKEVAVVDEEKAELLKRRLTKLAGGATETPIIHSGPTAIETIIVSPEINTAIFASSGTDALNALKKAIIAGKKIALANKELLVAHGHEIMELSHKHNNPIIPVDSEHSAIYQCLKGESKNSIEKIILTCSGGPFYGYTKKQLEKVTPEQALKHPKWNMGTKISIDSATLMNKGFEIIEACHLFNLKPEQIEIAIHPECIVHSIVQFKDGSAKAQLSTPDMRHAIAYALATEENIRPQTSLPRLSFQDISSLTFHPPDLKTFEGPTICTKAFNKGGATPAEMEKANTKAVNLFLNRQIKFNEIYTFVSDSLKGIKN